MYNAACLNQKLFCEFHNLACLAIPGIRIMYLWDNSGGSDLDTMTSCMGESVGYGRGGGITKKTYIGIDRDDTSSNGRETITVYSKRIRTLQDEVTVSMAAAWYGTPAGGNFKIKITWGSYSEEKSFSTMTRYSSGSYYSCGSVTFDLVNKQIIW